MIDAVLITGASRGIGRETLLEFARRGYNVVGVCKNSEELLMEAVSEAKEFGVEAFGISGVDVGNYEQMQRILYEKLVDKNININIIVNNAGISYVGLLQDMDISEWKNIVDTNLTSLFNTSKLFLPEMIRTGRGKIINVSSVWGNVGASCEVAYSATKGGVNSFTKALAKELAPSDIQVNAIAFGAMDTEMNNHLTQEDKESLAEEIPMGRFGQVMEAAKMIADIAESPKYLTGQVITMDGGWI